MWIGIAYAGIALAAPKPDARAQYKLAVELDDNGEHEQALAAVEAGLAIAPRDLALLGLKGTVLIKLRDYAAALVAYQAYLAAGPTGANRRGAQKIVDNLRKVESTFIEVTLANGPADVYLDSKTQGVFCAAAPSCKRTVLPGTYRVIVERPGFEPSTGGVTVDSGKTVPYAVTLVEKPSLLTVTVEPAGASVMVDDAAWTAPTAIAPGKHRVVATHPDHATSEVEVEARQGAPIELRLSLSQLVPISVRPASAQLLLDDKPVTARDGRIAIPPGGHVLIARAQGFEDSRTDIAADRAPDYKLALELAPVELPPPAVVPRREPGRFTDRRKVALAAGGIALIALADAIRAGSESGKLDDDVLALCPASSNPCPAALEASDLDRRAQTFASEASAAYAIAGGAALAAIALWLTGAPESRRVEVAPRVGGVAGLDLRMRF